ncbi:MAG: hypothetical protein MMC23_003199 [Stictis urceolatum]|nr:hypothetical protein [Stictis urceolata]
MSTPFLFSPSSHTHLLPSLASLHATCITQDHTISTFTLPLNPTALQTWWTARARDIDSGTRLLVLSTNADGNEVKGAALLSMPWSQTGPFRAVVEGLWVAPDARRRGLGRRLVETMEGEARVRGRGLVMPDGEAGGLVEMFWDRMGYTKMGVIPDRAIAPHDGTFRDMAIYHKDLRKAGAEIAAG